MTTPKSFYETLLDDACKTKIEERSIGVEVVVVVGNVVVDNAEVVFEVGVNVVEVVLEVVDNDVVVVVVVVSAVEIKLFKVVLEVGNAMVVVEVEADNVVEVRLDNAVVVLEVVGNALVVFVVGNAVDVVETRLEVVEIAEAIEVVGSEINGVMLVDCFVFIVEGVRAIVVEVALEVFGNAMTVVGRLVVEDGEVIVVGFCESKPTREAKKAEKTKVKARQTAKKGTAIFFNSL